MDGNQQRRSSHSSSLAMSPPNDIDDSDTISLTSTIEAEEDPDTEYVVDGVHAEREIEVDGERTPRFLVEWANFPLDQCTWEPLEHLTPELAKQWEEKKATQDPKMADDFEERYLAAFNSELEAARQRHRRRNAKRKTRGFPTTPFYFRGYEESDSENEAHSEREIPDSDVEPSSHSSEDAELDEAEEDNGIDHKATEALEPVKKTSRKNLSREVRPPNRTFTFRADTAPSTEALAANAKRKSSTLDRPAKTSISSGSFENASRDRELPSATGYKGSAQKPSKVDSSTRLKDVGRTKPGTVNPAITRHAKTGALEAKPSASAATPVSLPRLGSGPAFAAAAAAAPSKAENKLRLGRKTVMKKPIPPPNIFVGGTSRKKRISIGQIETDETKQSKPFQNAQQQQKSVMRSRDRADQAPPIEKVAPVLFAPGSTTRKGQPIQQQRASKNVDGVKDVPVGGAEDPQGQHNTLQPCQVARSSGLADGPALPVRAPKRSSLSSITDRPMKKAKKSVRFDQEAEVLKEANTSMQPTSHKLSTLQSISSSFGERLPTKDDSSRITDDGLFVSEPMEIDDNAPSSKEPVRKLSLSKYKLRNTRSVGKKIRFSTSPASELDVTFDSIPPSISPNATEPAWLCDFLGMDCLEVGHMFLAESFVSQLPSLQGVQLLCSGLVTSDDNGKPVETLVEHLRSGSFGLFIAQTHFNLVLFPAKCTEFDKLSGFGIEPTRPGNDGLKYFMFSSSYPISQLVRPLSNTVEGLPGMEKVVAGREKVVLFPTILGLQYSLLIALAPSDKKRKLHFFLAFPLRPGALAWQGAIGSWLSIREPSCKIYTNFLEGSWVAFCEMARKERGVIIVHEAFVPCMRRFPLLHKLLIKSDVVVWRFSESLGSNPPRTLVESSIVPALSPRCSSLFPLGAVILVTPSFLVSEPQKAFELLDWFFGKRAKTFPANKLVLAYNIVDYLTELSAKKIKLREYLETSLWHGQKDLQVAMDKNASALTDEDLKARQKTWLKMSHWMSQQEDRDGPFSDNSSVITVDRSIDPHDEQSLVNWFGWWSMAHCQEYRKFYVVGSRSKRPNYGPLSPTLANRMSCKIKIPRYGSSVLNDPDKALRIALKKTGQLEAQNGSHAHQFHSECFSNDENRIRPWLADHSGFASVTFNKPVYWADAEMGNHFGDAAMQFATIQQWWDTIRPWNNLKNTYIAFFHTISDEWRPEDFPKGEKPRRHTWLAIWRPVDVHLKQNYGLGKTELIIWDARAGHELEEIPTLTERDLTWMQQALVKHIRLHAHEKEATYHLASIWMGGFQAQQKLQPVLESMLPVDKTVKWLLLMHEDLRYTLPAASYHLRARKYRQLLLRETQPHTAPKVEEDDDDPDIRIIFHPPRAGENLQPEARSKCTNHLFEESRMARIVHNNDTGMNYTYRPTMDWYQDQVAEGRHFGHILVDEWETVFSVMRVGVSTPTTSDRPPPAPVRAGSASSTHSSSTY